MSARRITKRQQEVLTFFLGPNHGITDPDDAEERVEELLDDPETGGEWEDFKEKPAATDRQRARLEWASKRLNRPLPEPLFKNQASKLITQWFERENPGLEQEWYQEKDRRESQELRESCVEDEVDDWREIYHFKKIPRPIFREAYWAISGRGQSEPIDRYMERLFREIGRIAPSLACAPPKQPPRRSPRHRKQSFPIWSLLKIFFR